MRPDKIILDDPEFRAPAPTLIVAGQGRCGTSLVMQMLARAGVAVTGNAPTYEVVPEETSPAYWRENFGGKAIKILDPHLKRPPFGLQYRAIWLDRNLEQQALSQVKLLKQLGYDVLTDRRAIKRLVKLNRKNRSYAVNVLRSLAGPENCIGTTFEHLINSPHLAAKQIYEKFKEFVPEHPGKSDAAVILEMAAVVKFRHADCYNGLLELGLPGFKEKILEAQS
jgi:hypothetical protein